MLHRRALDPPVESIMVLKRQARKMLTEIWDLATSFTHMLDARRHIVSYESNEKGH